MKATFDSRAAAREHDARPASESELNLPSLLTPLDESSQHRYVPVSRTLSVLVLFIAALALIGQVSGMTWLARWSTDTKVVRMAPSTAITFLAIGAALLGASLNRSRLLILFVASVASVWGAIKFGEWLLHVSIGYTFSVEQWLTAQVDSKFNVMSPITGASFLLCSLSLLLVLRRGSTAAGILVNIAGALNVLVLMGYLYNAPEIYGQTYDLPVALPTAVAFLLFVFGHIALSGPEAYPLRLFVGHNTQAMLLRSFLPLLFAVVLLEGLLRNRVLIHLVDPKYVPVYSAAVSIAVCVGVLPFLVWRVSLLIGHKIDAAEEARERALKTLRLAKDTAEQANLAKSQFLANMSHELRTPLNAIMGYSELLQEEASDDGQNQYIPDLERIHSSGKHLLTLINDILDLSKIEAGKMELFLETFDLDPFLDELRATVQPLAARNANQLVVEKPSTLGKVHLDITRLRQCLFNLLSNACKFTKQGTITLVARRDDRWLTLSVKDSGIGMTPEQLGKLFKPFVQADNSTTRQYGGTGLGLTICLKLCDMLGGSIQVESEPGQGSTFTLRLPVDPRKTAGKSSGDSITPQPLKPKGTVLVIDDDSAVRDVLTRFLTREGFRTLTAEGGLEGLQMAREKHPDAITLDVMMPGMDGWSVLLALKADPNLAEIPVIMLTIVDDRNLGYTLGAVEYLTKPVDRRRLLSVLKKYCPGVGRSVLIVEDEPATRDVLKRTLEGDGWQVTEAENGRVGLEQVHRQCPDLILLDLMMPEMDGFEFVRQLRQKEEWRSVPVLVVTAKSITSEDRALLKGHVSQVLQKGAYSREDLLREVSSTLARQLPHSV